MFRSQCTTRSGKPAKDSASNNEVIEPDHRIVFAVLAIGMLVGALLTTPAKAPAKLQTTAAATVASKQVASTH